MDVQERLIHLIGEERRDGSLLVHSPEVSLLHLAIASIEKIDTVVLPILKTMMEHNLGKTVKLRRVETLEFDVPDEMRPSSITSHVIARMVAQ